jgi:hypothetical protein
LSIAKVAYLIPFTGLSIDRQPSLPFVGSLLSHFVCIVRPSADHLQQPTMMGSIMPIQYLWFLFTCLDLKKNASFSFVMDLHEIHPPSILGFTYDHL